MLSPKQIEVLRWPYTGRRALICDGAVRSGKTSVMSLSFILWAMGRFNGCAFAVCGKSVGSVERNILTPLLSVRYLQEHFSLCYNRGGHVLTVRRGTRENRFYLFGGKDESSYTLIQGVTLAGALLDEAALMPRSFVEQTAARCSVSGSRLWFSCNPESPAHWFYQEWVLKAEEKNALRLHFTMEDNPGLSDEVRRRYENTFQGTFYRRFVLGEWAAAEGLVYDFFDQGFVQEAPEGPFQEWYVSVDYGTANPTSMGLWGRKNGVWYRVDEYYYDGRAERRQKTDEEYAGDLARLAGGRPVRAVIADPSAASFRETLRRKGWRVRKADNQVVSGIRLTAQLLKSGGIVICRGCGNAIREFSLYRWDDRAPGQDQVRKEHDHAMDEIRYFAATVAAKEGRGGMFAGCVERGRF